MLSKGTILGHYRILECIGAGGMGEVYLADDTSIERRVAIKVVRSGPQQHPDSAASQEASRLFQREMKAITLLYHPNILAMFEFGEQMLEDASLTYMVMPYHKEGSLNDWLHRLGSHKKLSLDDIDHLITQAANALQYAHDHHIVHQDVKPSNFLIREHPNRPLRPDLLLTDFGLAKLTNTLTTDSQQVRGTPTFMPPEQWRGKPVPATDQYALAILAYQLMTGSPPFTGGMEQIMYQHLTASPTPPRAYSPSISSEIDAVILRALAKEPKERFPSINDFAAALHTAMLSCEELQPTLRVDNRPPKEDTPPTIVVPPSSSPPSQDLPPSLTPSPVPVNLPPPNKAFKISPAIFLIALAIMLSASASLVYFARLSLPHTPTSTPTATQTSAILPASALVTPGTLTVAVSDSSYNAPPEIYSNNGSPAGFDVNLGIALAGAMRLNVYIKPYPVGNLIPPTLFTTLKNKTFDIMINGQVLTNQVSNNTLSVPYLAPKDVVLVPDGNPGYLHFNTLTDLCGHTVGAQDNTFELYKLQTTQCPQEKINAAPFPDADTLANALSQKQVEAIYQGTPTVSYYQYKYPGEFQQVGNPLPLVQEGIIIRLDNDAMHTAIENALKSLEQDGTYQKLLNTPMGDLTGDSIAPTSAGTPTAAPST